MNGVRPSRSGSIRALRIIVADDDARMREFYEEVLRRMGHRVVASLGDGAALMEACESVDADLVVTDIRMPKVSGIEAARAVTEKVTLPFLFVSAYHDDALIDEASSTFSYGYLVKPIKQQQLAAMIPIAMRRYWDRLHAERSVREVPGSRG